MRKNKEIRELNFEEEKEISGGEMKIKSKKMTNKVFEDLSSHPVVVFYGGPFIGNPVIKVPKKSAEELIPNSPSPDSKEKNDK